MSITCTVKPASVATCRDQPPILGGHILGHGSVWITFDGWLPMYAGHWALLSIKIIQNQAGCHAGSVMLCLPLSDWAVWITFYQEPGNQCNRKSPALCLRIFGLGLNSLLPMFCKLAAWLHQGVQPYRNKKWYRLFRHL